MKKSLYALTLAVAFAFFAVYVTTSGCSSDPAPADDSVQVTTINSSWSVMPSDMLSQSQNAADSFSWRSFIAVCWPADTNSCGPDTTKTILSGTGPLVWETYLTTDQVFVSPGNQPAAWCGNSNSANNLKHLPPKVAAMVQSTGVTRVIHLSSKSPSGMEGLDQASGGPLVDQNGRFARYEVRMNYDEYDYIMDNTLWSKAGQDTFVAHGGQFDFPRGPVGAMEFKAAWKVMGPGDDQSDFYTIQAIVYNDSVGDPSPYPGPVTLGLVGLHIAHKTVSQGQWIWSTFEHVDNLTKSFYNPACDTCAVNQPITGAQIELNPDGTPIHKPTQVVRVNPVQGPGPNADPNLDSINDYFQGLLSGSVWANYELVGTQWLYFEHIAPKYLANSVQETYLQGPSPWSYGGYPLIIDEEYYKDSRYQPFSDSVSSSCMGCHYVATSAGIRSDFSFIISDAQ